ncbi:hypothetical protein LTR10_018939 [Elasticomyces elasticus]|uniref:NAD-dependent epimerase/dehydratase domain-containing protein n=1 Tax=Exophiala sideris TaxID=1016849 RepID=A0ABR0IY02_9EURO|nr:hypothetical protein LTR10_018939 [Elasticomyces elasticus]KAK5022307.1 hypothetical protein LTS07_010183 [Exophiala sideris]KAK5027119.1 hypothetical protein LTR13_009729 [Exophiala sideris]KAK5051694.1 hypothetical protein LTR69_010194 [Exophiala sideris]KAK5177659.1 hypothetical protein LTR44_009849 [Eurotiomycetes sp. CCFEE 6388]
MSHRILITGASGYLGGTILARWNTVALPTLDKLFALVRTDDQATAVSQLYGAEPLQFNVKNEAAVRDAIVSNKISIVFFLIDAATVEAQVLFITALAEVKKLTGLDVHFLHTSGAKLFSNHAGTPHDKPFTDTVPDLYDMQKAQRPLLSPLGRAVDANNTVVELDEQLGVQTYLFVPCIVYGQGEGFANKLSIQTVAIIKAAHAARRVYDVNSTGQAVWPICHVRDTTSLYLQILYSILAGEKPNHGKKGYYLAASGSIAWKELYSVMAKALAARGIVDDANVAPANDESLEAMAKGLGCPKEFVSLQLGGMYVYARHVKYNQVLTFGVRRCTFTAQNGTKLGWRPHFASSHILETAKEEVDLILDTLKL